MSTPEEGPWSWSPLRCPGTQDSSHTSWPGPAASHRPDLSPVGADSRYADLRLHNVVARVPGT
ncbi:hypothetical protein, partial [Streptomyces sp. NPDC059131]|uniref:hypothetical protein n=1 Tax=Streptomyces sp. NPDC059131 TaxID=3346736 RepID=UPI0036CB782B